MREQDSVRGSVGDGGGARFRHGGRRAGEIDFQHPRAFWAGVALVVAGTLLQLPPYFDSADMGYVMVGMSMGSGMVLGMVLMVAGFGLGVYGILPPKRDVVTAPIPIRITALDDAPLTRAHVALILVMAAAITIDVMKPTTLAFVAPGVATEYGLRSSLFPDSAGLPVALLPLAGITGTVIGSVLWGGLADRIGRRAAILVASIAFIATSTCGAMPSFEINIAMCLLMGLGVGGMLPIIFSLVSETVPSRHRGWIIVLIGGDVAGAYVIMSWLASTIGAPDRYGWRALWLIGIPVSLLLVLLNRWIPESPRYLLQRGRVAEARAVMARYGATAIEVAPGEAGYQASHGHYGQLFRSPYLSLTAVLVALGLGIGVVQYGFHQWIPSNLQELGLGEVESNRLLRDAALIGFPLNIPVALLYGFWSSRRTIVGMALLTAAALVGFALLGDGVADRRGLLFLLLVPPIWGVSSLTAVTAAYAAEIYPTGVRGRGTGLTAAATKFGGVGILAAVAAAVATPSIGVTALLGAIPLLGAVGLILAFGVETRSKGLEQITLEAMGSPATAIPVARD